MKAVVLLSGGMDSAVALAMAMNEGRECHALIVDYGQRNRRETELAIQFADSMGVAYRLSTVGLPIADGVAGRGRLDTNRPIERIGAKGDKPLSYVPARNTILLSLAVSMAESIGAEEIWIGANKDDHAGFPDCRMRFFRSFIVTAMLGTRIEKPLEIRAPLLESSKVQVASLGKSLGVDFSKTSSCYFGTECGECDACTLRNYALKGIQ